MADTVSQSKRLTLREFLDWEARQPRKYELIGGLVKMMAGGTQDHNQIALNIAATLREKLRGKPCRACNSDVKVLVAAGQSYYPDASVDCGPRQGKSMEATEPTVIFEVLSASTRDDDLKLKLPAYQATPSIRQIVYVEPDRMHLMIWRRGAEGWEEDEVVRPEERLTLDSLGADLSFAEIYEDVFG